MIAASDLVSIELFSKLTSQERQHFAMTAADVRVRAGDWLVYEGERSGFFVLLEGRVQFTKDIHGQEYEIETYGPGEFFGEFPNLTGTFSAVSMRAVTKCRVARFELQQLQELIQESSPSSEPIFRRMIEGVLLAQHFAKLVPKARAIITGSANSRIAHEIQAFLAGNRIPYRWENPEGTSRPTGASADQLTVLVDGKHTLTNPSLRMLAEAFGFQTKPARRTSYDLVVVGAGPAGMAAAVYGASEGLSVLVIERCQAGGQAGTSSRISNYLGFPGGISGDDLSDRALKQAKWFGAEIVMTRSVKTIVREGNAYCVSLDEGERVPARALLLAIGVDWRRLDVPGLEDFLSRGVSYGFSRTEAANVRGKSIFIVGGGNSAGQAAMFFSDYAKDVRLLVRGAGLSSCMSQYLIEQLSSKRNITIEPFTQVTGLGGEDALDYLVTSAKQPGHKARVRSRPADALYIMIGAHANTGWLPSEIKRDAKGFLCTGRDVQGSNVGRARFPLETSLEGVFCAGDVRYGSIKRVASAVGEGSMAISFIHQYLALNH
jgi:thioredoxin reductase (NADPH)